MFDKTDLLDIVRSQAEYHRNEWKHLKNVDPSIRNMDHFYRHHHLYLAMSQVADILANNGDQESRESISTMPTEDVGNASQFPESQSKRADVMSFLDKIDGFEGIDPFDVSLKLFARIDALVLYIMSDGKQRNASSVKEKIQELLPDEGIDEKIVARRVYALDKRRQLLEPQTSRGFYRIKEECIKS